MLLLYYLFNKRCSKSDIYSFECFIYNEGNEEVASATINVYQSDDDNIKELIDG